MFALDLFNTRYERDLREGAVDDLEGRRIDDLNAKMQDLLARARDAKTPEHKTSLKREFDKVKDERDSYYKIREGGIPGNVPTEKIPGKEDLLKGKGRSYYEAQIQKKNSKEIDEHGGGIGPKQHWQDLMQERKLSVGDPVVVTGPNEFEGKTGEIDEFSPSGTFVIVNLYNHGKHSMHLSDIAYNEYANQEQDEEDDWYDEEMEEGYAATIGPDTAPLPPEKQWRIQVRQLIADYIKNPQGLYNIAKQKGANSAEATAYKYIMHPTGKIALPPDAVTFEGYQDFNKVEPYAVCLAGKPVKKFDYYEEARRFHDNWKKKLYREGNKEKADKITLMPLNLDEEEQKPAGWGEFPPKQEITILPPKKLKSGQTYQDQNKYWQSQGQAPIYKTNEAGSPAQQAAIAIAKKKEQGVAEGDPNADPYYVYDYKNLDKRPLKFKTREGAKAYAEKHGLEYCSAGFYHDKVKTKQAEPVRKIKEPQGYDDRIERPSYGMNEVQTDYSKRRARERDVDAGKPVARQRPSKQTDYQKRRAQDKKDMELGEMDNYPHPDSKEGKALMKAIRDPNAKIGKPQSAKKTVSQATKLLNKEFKKNVKEESSTSSDAVERSILNRIMTAHTDLLMKFGPEKVMQAAEEVAYNVGDVDEIGTSDVSAYVAQVKQILGVPSEVNEKWSQKYKSSINCANPKGFSQKAHCAGRKK